MIKSKTYNTTPGTNFIEGTELAFTTIYEVRREGLQYDLYSTSSNRSYVYEQATGRVHFNSVFNSGEKVFVIYKETSTVVVPIPGVCVPVVIPATTLPNGVVGIPYNVAITLEGSEPFELNNSIIVAWLDVAIDPINSRIVYLTGTTPVEGTWSVMFDVTNCNGATDEFFGTFDILPAPITFIVNNQSPGNITNVSGSYTILSGSFPILFNQSITGVHPALTAAITVRISGLVFTYSLSLSKNGTPLEVIPVFAAGNYTFGSQTFLSADILQIDLL